MKFLKHIKWVCCCSMTQPAPANQVWEEDQDTCTYFLAPPETRSVGPCSQGGTGSGTGNQPSSPRYQHPAMKQQNKPKQQINYNKHHLQKRYCCRQEEKGMKIYIRCKNKDAYIALS